VLPVQVLVGLGLGFVMAPAMNYATHGIRPEDSGVASATVNTSQQIFASVGTALANTVASSATATYLASHQPSATLANDAVVHGFAQASGVMALILLVGAAIVGVLMNTPKPDPAAFAGEQPMAVHI